MESQLQAEGFYKDTALVKNESGANEQAIPAPGEAANSNMNEMLRWQMTDKNQTVSLEGPLHIDVCQMDRLIPNQVQIVVKLFPSLSSFCLRTGGSCTEKYKVIIMDAVLKVCHVEVNPKIMVAHNEIFGQNDALYPMW